MPRQPDIHAAFIAAIQQNPKGYLCLYTDKCIAELQDRHWHFSQSDANSRSSVISPTLPIRARTAAATVTGSFAIWGGCTDGISFTGG
ncbi:hypothetical protein ENROMA047B_20805 [Enterobacter rongchengensis]